MEKAVSFPQGFYWGSATSSHQVEGDNFNDWTLWEESNADRLAQQANQYASESQKQKFPQMLEPANYLSGIACDHYNRFEEDFDILSELNQNAYRFSIEWSRIEPEAGKFDRAEVDHYRKVIAALRKRNIEPFVTLWHWTNPTWLDFREGFGGHKFHEYFQKYVEFIVTELGDEVKYWITLNEPMSVLLNGYLRRVWPPMKSNPLSCQLAFRKFVRSHNKAYETIKKIRPDAQVGSSQILSFFEASNPQSKLEKKIVSMLKHYSNDKFLEQTRDSHDFIGVNYYFHTKIKFPLLSVTDNQRQTDMGWEIYPQGLYHILLDVAKYNLPVYITENGLADSADQQRERFIKEHLFFVNSAMQRGVDVRGYFYWSLLDNFEWDKGYWPQFGLVHVDHNTLERKIKDSAREYAEICRTNQIIYK